MRIVEVEKFEIEENFETNLRPEIWDEYIGQETIKENLKVFIQAAKIRNEHLDHILFFGPPGLGKTTLAHIIANEMESNIKVVAAPMIEKTGDLAAILSNLQNGDILFIDEIHRLKASIEEVLYPAMEDYRLDLVIGSGPAAQTIKIDIEKFTLIGATTKAGMLSNPLRDRFGMNFRLQFYNDKELSKIIKIASNKLNKPIEYESALEIAKRSRGTPRIALRLLKRIRDFSDVAGEEKITIKTTKYALNKLGVNVNGFDELDLSYLRLLCNAKKALGLSTISAALSEDEETIEDVIEPFLLTNGYIERTARGRIATRKSYELLHLNNINSEGNIFD
jgi:Holliday junction DNA helicase RuvB